VKQELTATKTGEHTCPWWLLFTFDNPLRSLVHNPQKILGPYVKQGNTVLDIGCGMGFFTLGLAELVGQDGRVIAADMQQQMLAGLQKRAERAGLHERIQLCRSTPDDIGANEAVDFVLAFWMVHEVRQPTLFLRQIHRLLVTGGNFLIVEPIIHVTGRAFGQTVSLAIGTGFRVVDQPRIRVSRAVLLEKQVVNRNLLT
jgi:ubiquinone/menaquinone biosynthesis C-methylase UbiE